MKIYSPSKTARYMTCPMLATLHRDGWRSKHVTVSHPAQVIGKALAAGLAVYNNIRKQTEAFGVAIDKVSGDVKAGWAKSCMEIAFAVAQQEMSEAESLGYVFDSTAEITFKSMQDRIGKPLTRYIVSDPLPASWRIVDVERDYGAEYGSCRPDLIVRDDFGLAVVDYKSKTSSYKTTIPEYAHMSQMKQYLYFGSKLYGAQMTRYHIVAIQTMTGNITTLPYTESPEALELWYSSTAPMWEYIGKLESGEARPWMASEHGTKYGPCVYKRACLEFNLDPDLMKQEYIKVEAPSA